MNPKSLARKLRRLADLIEKVDNVSPSNTSGDTVLKLAKSTTARRLLTGVTNDLLAFVLIKKVKPRRWPHPGPFEGGFPQVKDIDWDSWLNFFC